MLSLPTFILYCSLSLLNFKQRLFSKTFYVFRYILNCKQNDPLYFPHLIPNEKRTIHINHIFQIKTKINKFFSVHVHLSPLSTATAMANPSYYMSIIQFQLSSKACEEKGRYKNHFTYLPTSLTTYSSYLYSYRSYTALSSPSRGEALRARLSSLLLASGLSCSTEFLSWVMSSRHLLVCAHCCFLAGFLVG